MICFDKSVRETEFQAENGDAGGGLFWRTVIDSNIPLKLGHGLFFPTYLEESFCLVWSNSLGEILFNNVSMLK